MKEYHKIHSIYKRDPKTNYKTFLEGEFSRPEFEYLFYNQWLSTEKVDGTNIRIIVFTYKEVPDSRKEISFEIKGKTDKAQIPIFLMDKLKEIFTNDKIELLSDLVEAPEVCLYGEGYGARINKGGVYIPNGVDFILFDVKIGDWWLKREDVEEIAKKLEIQIVPIIAVGTLQQAIASIKLENVISKLRVDGGLAEGLVLKPIIELRDRAGRRIITKIKHKDYNIKEEK